ncbi:MAG: hypothetical protein L0221_16730 [Chloroflexi bacterium]|nr:hypothetical protein [Chloroflexota bacterium]
MNYYEARQVDPKSDRPDAGKWRYTVRNDDQVWAVGYCTACPGHDDREGAYQHQTEYLLAERLKLDGQWDGTQFRCVAPVRADGAESPCGEWTDRFAEVGHWWTGNLCDRHRTRDVVAELFGTAGDVISSH